MLKLVDLKKNSAEVAAVDTFDNLWARYVCARHMDACGDFRMSGKEYEAVLRLYRFDPRAAAMYLDVNVSVRAEQLVDTYAPALTCGEKHTGDLIVSGVTREIALMRYKGSIPGAGATIYDSMDINWDEFNFVRESDMKDVPSYVNSFRREMISVPDYSNVLELPREEPLAKAN